MLNLVSMTDESIRKKFIQPYIQFKFSKIVIKLDIKFSDIVIDWRLNRLGDRNLISIFTGFIFSKLGRRNKIKSGNFNIYVSSTLPNLISILNKFNFHINKVTRL